MSLFRQVSHGKCPESGGEFPNASPAVQEAPETLRPPHSGYVRCAESGCFPRVRLKCAECGCYPGRDIGCAESGCFPGRDDRCAEDGISSDETNIICVNDYCIIIV